MVHEKSLQKSPTDSLLAQLAKHETDDPEVASSNPTGSHFWQNIFCSVWFQICRIIWQKCVRFLYHEKPECNQISQQSRFSKKTHKSDISGIFVQNWHQGVSKSVKNKVASGWNCTHSTNHLWITRQMPTPFCNPDMCWIELHLLDFDNL